MDDLTLLREVRDEVAAPTPESLAPARQRLLDRAVGTVDRPRPRRTPLVLATAAAFALVAAVGVVVAEPFGGTPATATGLLHRAADRAGDGPVAGPGQYLAVETRESALAYLEGTRGAYRATSVSTTYVPHDRDGTWVRRYWTQAPSDFYGGADVRRAAAQDHAADATADDPGVEKAPGGRFGNGELGGGSAGLGPADLPTLPRDPGRLLRSLEANGGKSESPSQAAIQSASTLLRTGLVPLDLRRALFDALALLPDVRIVDHTVTMSGRSGTAIGVRDDYATWSVVIDPDSGDYLGDLQVQRHRIGAVPAGTVVDQTSLSTTVVDRLPSR